MRKYACIVVLVASLLSNPLDARAFAPLKGRWTFTLMPEGQVMVITGFPLLTALAAAQVQSVFVASSGMFSYFAQGSISWPLVLITGIPEMIGVWLGWKIAHVVPTRPLKLLLAATLIALGPILLLTH